MTENSAKEHQSGRDRSFSLDLSSFLHHVDNSLLHRFDGFDFIPFGPEFVHACWPPTLIYLWEKEIFVQSLLVPQEFRRRIGRSKAITCKHFSPVKSSARKQSFNLLDLIKQKKKKLQGQILILFRWLRRWMTSQPWCH